METILAILVAAVGNVVGGLILRGIDKLSPRVGAFLHRLTSPLRGTDESASRHWFSIYCLAMLVAITSIFAPALLGFGPGLELWRFPYIAGVAVMTVALRRVATWLWSAPGFGRGLVILMLAQYACFLPVAVWLIAAVSDR